MSSPNAAEILARTHSLYSTCRSYTDEGENTTVAITGPAPWQRRTSRIVFRTAFVRGLGFYFEFRHVEVGPESEWQRAVVWERSGRAEQWWTLGGPYRRDTDLETSLGGLAEWSCRTSVNVPKLLLPELDVGDVLPEPSTAVCLEREGDTDVGVGAGGVSVGGACVRGRANVRPLARDITVSIDAAGALIRLEDRIEFTAERQRELQDQAIARVRAGTMDAHRQEITLRGIREGMVPHTRDVTTESTTTWRPRFDVQVDLATFDFTPPS